MASKYTKSEKESYMNYYRQAKKRGDKKILTFAEHLNRKGKKKTKPAPPDTYGQRSGRVSISDRRRASGKAYEEATGRRSPYKRK